MNSTIKLDAEFQELLRSASQEPSDLLEKDILTGGVRDKLIVWDETDTLLDGYTRYKICEKHHIIYDIKRIKLPSREAAKRWIIINQLERRNLTAFRRAELVVHLEPLYVEMGKENMAMGGVNKGSMPEAKPVSTRDELAKLAEISGRSFDKVKVILAKASEKDKENLRSGKVTINRVFLRIDKTKEVKDETPEVKHRGKIVDAGKELAKLLEKYPKNEFSKDNLRVISAHLKPLITEMEKFIFGAD